MDDLTDLELVSRYLEGDVSAFTVFYMRHEGKLYNYIRNKLANYSSEVDDIFQATWMDWQELCLLGEKKAQDLGPSLLFTMGKNKSLDHIKKYKKETSLDGLEDEGESKLSQIVDENALLSAEGVSLIASSYQVIDLQIQEAKAKVAASQKEFDKASEKKKLEKIILLAEEQKKILDYRGLGYSRAEVADISGLSVDRVRYREEQLRELMTEAGLLL